MENIITKITVLGGSGVKSFEVGVDGVASILDKSAEFENSIDFIYWVWNEKGETIHEIINCPVVLDLKKL